MTNLTDGLYEKRNGVIAIDWDYFRENGLSPEECYIRDKYNITKDETVHSLWMSFNINYEGIKNLKNFDKLFSEILDGVENEMCVSAKDHGESWFDTEDIISLGRLDLSDENGNWTCNDIDNLESFINNSGQMKNALILRNFCYEESSSDWAAAIIEGTREKIREELQTIEGYRNLVDKCGGKYIGVLIENLELDEDVIDTLARDGTPGDVISYTYNFYAEDEGALEPGLAQSVLNGIKYAVKNNNFEDYTTVREASYDGNFEKIWNADMSIDRINEIINGIVVVNQNPDYVFRAFNAIDNNMTDNPMPEELKDWLKDIFIQYIPENARNGHNEPASDFFNHLRFLNSDFYSKSPEVRYNAMVEFIRPADKEKTFERLINLQKDNIVKNVAEKFEDITNDILLSGKSVIENAPSFSFGNEYDIIKVFDKGLEKYGIDFGNDSDQRITFYPEDNTLSYKVTISDMPLNINVRVNPGYIKDITHTSEKKQILSPELPEDSFRKTNGEYKAYIRLYREEPCREEPENKYHSCIEMGKRDRLTPSSEKGWVELSDYGLDMKDGKVIEKENKKTLNRDEEER